MKTRNGQVAIYLVMVLLAIAVLMFANVNAFLAVRAKNQMMNAVDYATIAVAKHQGRLLNEVGRLNVEHLRAAVKGEEWTGADGEDKMAELRTLVFMRPLEGVRLANDAARAWGFEGGSEPEAVAAFTDHIAEILDYPDLYPRSEDNQLWPQYARALARAIGDDPVVLPRYVEMASPGMSGLFANGAFYDVIEAKAWCWFTVGNNAAYLEQDPSTAESGEIIPVEVPENSEVFSLHVTYKTWKDSDWADEWTGEGFSERWTNFVCQVTGLNPGDFSKRSKASDPDQIWAFYDDTWGKWSPSFNPDRLPLAGSLKPEYDVAGCVATSMMPGRIPQIEDEDGRRMMVTADAKPIGTVDVPGEGISPVTGFNRFIAPSRPGERIFTEAQLVLVDSVPHSVNCVCMASEWYDHVKKHSPASPEPSGCEYCRIWRKWMDQELRRQIRDWLNANSESCRAKGGGGGERMQGGYPYAH